MVLEISLRPRLDHQLRIANATTVLRIKQLIGFKSSFLASIFPGYKTVDKHSLATVIRSCTSETLSRIFMTIAEDWHGLKNACFET